MSYIQRCRSTWFRLSAILWLFAASLVVGQDLFTEPELQAMSDDQLENICTERGFGLVKDEIDPTTGLAYQFTHDDYVLAAQQCLAVEKEMNELLEQHPELAAELEEELKRMEAEVEERQAEVDNLQNELSDAEKSAAGDSSATGPAFVSSPKENNSEVKEASSMTGGDSNDAAVGNDDVGEANDDIVESHNVDTPMDSNEEERELEEEASIDIDDTVVTDETDTDVPLDLDGQDSSASDEEATSNDTSELAQGDEDKDGEKEDLTLNGMTIEIVKGLFKQAEADVKRIVELMTPMVQSMMRAGDTAWRHIRALIVSLQKQYEEARENRENANQAGDVVA